MAAWAKHAAGAVVVRIAAQLPVAVVDDDAAGAVVETDIDKIVRVAVQSRRAAILACARIHFQGAATAIAAAMATVGIASGTSRIVAIAAPRLAHRTDGVVHARHRAVFSRPQGAAIAAKTGIRTHIPGTRAHQDARHLVVEAHARQIVRRLAQVHCAATQINVFEQGDIARMGGRMGPQRKQQGGRACQRVFERARHD
ncbi:hypothetical protein D3C72_1457590 [compost metagenome]